jgi:23S rRNA pseudouridine2605 synthase
MKERIQKILGNAGVASRRHIEAMVREGRVAVNGKVLTDLPILVDPEKDEVIVDGETIRLRSRGGGPSGAERIYIIMNKPRGVYSTNVAQGVQKRVIDLLPEGFPRVYPVGRLEADSRGLLLLTNDGDLTNKLTHPRYGVPKTYRATVAGDVEPDRLKELERGVWLADIKTGKGFKTGRSQIKIVHRERESTVLDITIREGREGQVRRMLAKAGYKARDVVRTKIGPLSLERLAPGKFRPLTVKEVHTLQEFARHTEQRPPKPQKIQRGDAKGRPSSGKSESARENAKVRSHSSRR